MNIFFIKISGEIVSVEYTITLTTAIITIIISYFIIKVLRYDAH